MAFARGCVAVLLVMTLSLIGARAEARMMVGTNFGVSLLMPEEGDDDLIAVSVPGQAGTLFPGMMPGLRLGGSMAEGVHETYFDAAVSVLSIGDDNISTALFTANYQANFAPRSWISPYVTFGGGFVFVGYDRSSVTTPMAGGGVGLRRGLANDHGAFRFEARVDQFFDSDDAVFSGTAVGFKMGFDLYLD